MTVQEVFFFPPRCIQGFPVSFWVRKNFMAWELRLGVAVMIKKRTRRKRFAWLRGQISGEVSVTKLTWRTWNLPVWYRVRNSGTNLNTCWNRTAWSCSTEWAWFHQENPAVTQEEICVTETLSWSVYLNHVKKKEIKKKENNYYIKTTIAFANNEKFK